MTWKPSPESAGEYVIAFANTANGLRGFRHIVIIEDGTWVEPHDEQQLVYFGRHMNVLGYAKLKFPKKKHP